MNTKYIFTLILLGWIIPVKAQLFIDGQITVQSNATLYSSDSIILSDDANAQISGTLQTDKSIRTVGVPLRTLGNGKVLVNLRPGVTHRLDVSGSVGFEGFDISHNNAGPVVFQLSVKELLNRNPETETGTIDSNAVNCIWKIQPQSAVANMSLQLLWSQAQEENGFSRSSSAIAYWQSNQSTNWDMLDTASPASSTTLNGLTRYYNHVDNVSLAAQSYMFSVGDNESELGVYLTNLVSSVGSLNPSFSGYVTSYSMNVLTGINSLTLTPTINNPSGSLYLSLNGSAFNSISSGVVSSSLPLNFGLNTVLIKAVSSNGRFSKTYSLSINRAAPAFTMVEVSAFLQGLYLSNSTMTPAPYNASLNSSQLIADTVLVELHSNAFPYDSLFAWRGPIFTDGSIQSLFPSAILGNSYYLVIAHRNSIPIWSTSPIQLNLNSTFDFTSSASQAYGANQVEVETGVFALYSGDINQDGSIDFLDYPDLDLGALNGDLGYLTTDLNGDASVDFLDYPLIDQNSLNGVVMVRP